VSQELQTGSTGVAVEAVPEREVSCVAGAANLSTVECCSFVPELEVPCLSLELQTWSTAVAVEAALEGPVRCAKDGSKDGSCRCSTVGASGLVDSVDTVLNGY